MKNRRKPHSMKEDVSFPQGDERRKAKPKDSERARAREMMAKQEETSHPQIGGRQHTATKKKAGSRRKTN